jgi:hypothetical protein
VHLALESIPSTLAQAQIAATHRTKIQGAIHHTKSSLLSPMHTIFNDSEIVVSSTYKHVISISNLTNASAAKQSQTAITPANSTPKPTSMIAARDQNPT